MLQYNIDLYEWEVYIFKYLNRWQFLFKIEFIHFISIFNFFLSSVSPFVETFVIFLIEITQSILTSQNRYFCYNHKLLQSFILDLFGYKSTHFLSFFIFLQTIFKLKSLLLLLINNALASENSDNRSKFTALFQACSFAWSQFCCSKYLPSLCNLFLPFPYFPHPSSVYWFTIDKFPVLILSSLLLTSFKKGFFLMCRE